MLSGMSFPKEKQKCPLVDLALKTMVIIFPLCWGPGLGERDRDRPSGAEYGLPLAFRYKAQSKPWPLTVSSVREEQRQLA